MLGRPIHIRDFDGRRIASIQPLVLEATRERLVWSVGVFPRAVWRGREFDKLLLLL